MASICFLKSELSRFIWLSIAYITSYAITIGLFLPLQKAFILFSTNEILLVFLPHGIRILSFYMFGLKGAIYLLPASYIMFFILKQKGIDLNPVLPLASMFICYLGYWLIRALIFKGTPPTLAYVWPYFAATGLGAAVFNGTAMNYIQTGAISVFDIALVILGDMTGMATCLIAAVYFFRLARLVGSAYR